MEGDAPPVFGTWRRAYAVVLLALALEVALLAWLSGALT